MLAWAGQEQADACRSLDAADRIVGDGDMLPSFSNEVVESSVWPAHQLMPGALITSAEGASPVEPTPGAEP